MQTATDSGFNPETGNEAAVSITRPSAPACEPFLLPGEGLVATVTKRKVRIACEECGEPATHRHTYLLPNARCNPQSHAYRRDDCTWSADHEVFLCDEHGKRPPDVDGYGWCASFIVSPDQTRFAHMFLRWVEQSQ